MSEKEIIEEYLILRDRKSEIEEEIRIKSREVGKLLRLRREKDNRSLRSLARELGLSAAYLSDMEVGRRLVSRQFINLTK